MVRSAVTRDEWDRFRILAIRRDVAIQEQVAEAMRALLKAHESKMETK